MREDFTEDGVKKGCRYLTCDDVYCAHNKKVVAAIMNVGKRLSWTREECEDLVQMVAIKLDRKKIVFDPDRGTLEGFIATIAKNTALNIVRKQKKRIKCTGVDDIGAVKDLDALDNYEDRSIERMEAIELVRRGIREMYRIYPSKTQIDAFVMFSLKEMSGKEVARKLGVSESYVNVSANRCKKYLKEIITCLARDGYGNRGLSR